jgi:hypothetical protein
MSTAAPFPLRTTEAEERIVRVRITGAGAGTPANTLANGTSVSYLAATGKYRVTFDSRPGKTFTGFSFGFQAGTPSNVAGFSVALDDYTAPTSTAQGYIDVWVYDATPALVDLTSDMKLSLALTFKDT